MIVAPLLLVSALVAPAPQLHFSQDEDPAEYFSPDESCVLRVDPSQRFGKGAGRYRLTRDEEVVWEKSLPFTLLGVALSDEGLACGWAATGGRDSSRGELLVAVLDATGEPIGVEMTPRTHSRVFDGAPNPWPLGVVLDQERDCFVVRVADADVNRAVETWQRYRISTMERLPDLRPAEHLEADEDVRLRIHDARVLPGTGLFLVHWWRYERGAGAAFTVMQEDGSVVWRMDLPEDYFLEDHDEQHRLRQLVDEHGAIFEVGQEGRFDLRFVKEGRRVSFQAVRDERYGPRWRVRELARTPCEPLRPRELPKPPPIDGTGDGTGDAEASFRAVRRIARNGEFRYSLLRIEVPR